MAKTLSGSFTAKLAYRFTNDEELSNILDAATLEYLLSLSAGTGASQVDQMYRARLNVTSGSPNDDLDLAAGLTNVFGETITFATIKGILLKNRSTTVGDFLHLGPQGASNPFATPWGGITTAKNVIGPGDLHLTTNVGAGWAVTAGTGDILRVSYQGTSGSIDYDIVLLGVKA